MMDRARSGAPFTIFSARGDGSFLLNGTSLDQILLASHVRNKPVVLVSVAGPFRKGKSFLLNFFILYLRNQCRRDWLKESGAPLGGFSWRGGSQRETTGILLWSEVFLVTTPQGKEIAVVLMDTQGTFDIKSTMKECTTFFALSTMLSSVQIYNLSQNIQENDLQHLRLFCDYGRLAQKDVNEAPFQKLIFLIRDWSYPYEAEYGEVGGRRKLNDWLATSDCQNGELKGLREDLKSYFNDIACFLMPHPGLKVYSDKFHQGNLPSPMSLREAIGVENNLTASKDALEHYNCRMNQFCRGGYRSENEFRSGHEERRATALHVFDSTLKLGGKELEKRYRDKLVEDIERKFSDYIRYNEDQKPADTFCLLF
ncbi:atlastin-1-like isoform X1 [Amblyomma americanum]